MIDQTQSAECGWLCNKSVCWQYIASLLVSGRAFSVKKAVCAFQCCCVIVTVFPEIS